MLIYRIILIFYLFCFCLPSIYHYPQEDKHPQYYRAPDSCYAYRSLRIPYNIRYRGYSNYDWFQSCAGGFYNFLSKEKADVNSFCYLDEILAAVLTSTYFLNEDNYHNGKTLEQLNLRTKTDAIIIAIVKGNRTISNPSAKDTIESNDTLVIIGTHKSIDLAFSLLDGKD